MPGPLAGLKVLDFTTLLPGPYATMLMADMGADVLRIQSGSRPDITLLMPPYIPNTNIGACAAYLGRGKRSMTLNLKDERGVQVVRRLLEHYDVLVEQFRPGVMAAFGLDYESVRKINPRAIYCSLTGYGQAGPMYMRAGHDINYLSRAGLMSYSGRRDSGPCLSGMQIADVAAGSMNVVIGVLAAVVSRNGTGRGQYVDVAMTDGSVAFNALTGSMFLVDGVQYGFEEFLLNGGYLYDFYETSDGGYMSVGSLEPKFFEAFCRAIGRPDLVAGTVQPPDPAKVKDEVRRIFKSKTRDQWTEIFGRTDACVEPVLSLEEALSQPQAKERGWLVEVELPNGQRVRQLASPIKFSETPLHHGPAGVPADTHTREVLLELGYREEEIDTYRQEGVFS
jgi:alpha-methylacyl-CoA racemase